MDGGPAGAAARGETRPSSEVGSGSEDEGLWICRRDTDVVQRDTSVVSWDADVVQHPADEEDDDVLTSSSSFFSRILSGQGLEDGYGVHTGSSSFFSKILTGRARSTACRRPTAAAPAPSVCRAAVSTRGPRPRRPWRRRGPSPAPAG
ncbi:unnamed protein product [Prorocentrum cordatum]|uniref:Uncharacterized protein n=1 Tax=Prorocentrum cordatum TaxID=2364126 RepID=A0ABN9WBR7_9DINO|nr:unnamed protein product [Polarella glacialis]